MPAGAGLITIEANHQPEGVITTFGELDIIPPNQAVNRDRIVISAPAVLVPILSIAPIFLGHHPQRAEGNRPAGDVGDVKIKPYRLIGGKYRSSLNTEVVQD